MKTFEDAYMFLDLLMQKAIFNNQEYLFIYFDNEDVSAVIKLGLKQMGYQFDVDFQGLRYCVKVPA